MSSAIKLTAGAGVLAALGIWTFGSLVPEGESQARIPHPQQQPTRVAVEGITFESEALSLDAVGTSSALRSVMVHPEAAGEIVAIHFEAGDEVAEDEILMELDARDQKLALELAEIRLADARRLLERYSRPQGAEAVPINDLQTAETAVALARVERDRAALALEYRYVRASFAGVVGLTEFDVGDRVAPDNAVTTLDDRSALLISFEVPEMMHGKIAKGESLLLAPWQQPDLKLDGAVVDVGSRVDPQSRSFSVRARVANSDDALRPGMSFKVELRVPGRAYPVIPEVAVQWGAQGAYVWAVEDGAAVRTPVNIVQRRAGRVLVESELKQGDPIIVEGMQSVRAGQPVQPIGSS